MKLEPGRGILLPKSQYRPVRSGFYGHDLWLDQDLFLAPSHSELSRFLPRVHDHGDYWLVELFDESGKEVAGSSEPVAAEKLPRKQMVELQRQFETLNTHFETTQMDVDRRNALDQFRLPDPMGGDPFYRVYGSKLNRKLLVLWGFQPATSRSSHVEVARVFPDFNKNAPTNGTPPPVPPAPVPNPADSGVQNRDGRRQGWWRWLFPILFILLAIAALWALQYCQDNRGQVNPPPYIDNTACNPRVEICNDEPPHEFCDIYPSALVCVCQSDPNAAECSVNPPPPPPGDYCQRNPTVPECICILNPNAQVCLPTDGVDCTLQPAHPTCRVIPQPPIHDYCELNPTALYCVCQVNPRLPQCDKIDPVKPVVKPPIVKTPGEIDEPPAAQEPTSPVQLEITKFSERVLSPTRIELTLRAQRSDGEKLTDISWTVPGGGSDIAISPKLFNRNEVRIELPVRSEPYTIRLRANGGEIDETRMLRLKVNVESELSNSR